jgi:hypothetical protein
LCEAASTSITSGLLPSRIDLHSEHSPQGSTVGWTLGGALAVTPAMAALGVWVRRPGRWLALAVVERVFAATAVLSAAQGGLGPLWLAGGAALLGGLAWWQGAAVDRRLPVETSEIAEASLMLARRGIYVEPTCAQAAAAFSRLLAAGSIAAREATVVVLTGTGLKATPRYAEFLGVSI